MRKELLWAGIVGITFGLVIGFGVWRVQSKVTTENPVPTPTPVSEVGQFKIAINKPDNFGIITESPWAVSGITKGGNWVVVSTNEGDFLTQSTGDGTFSVDSEFQSGMNFLKAMTVSSRGEVASQKIIAVYSSSFQTSAASSATPEADMAKVVAQKLAIAQNPPKSYIGTVTDIIDSTIQIKSLDSQIQQIETDKNSVTVVNTKGTSNKSVKLTDIAIGDFIIAMGYVDGQDVLDVQRILIADSLSANDITLTLGTVKSVTSKSITVTPKVGGDAITFTPDKNTSLTSYTNGKTKSIKLASFSASDSVIIVSDVTGSPVLTRSIFNLGTQEN